MKKAKRRASIRLLATAAILLLLLAPAGCQFQPNATGAPAFSIAPGDVGTFLQDFALQALAAFLF